MVDKACSVHDVNNLILVQSAITLGLQLMQCFQFKMSESERVLSAIE